VQEQTSAMVISKKKYLFIFNQFLLNNLVRKNNKKRR